MDSSCRVPLLGIRGNSSCGLPDGDAADGFDRTGPQQAGEMIVFIDAEDAALQLFIFTLGQQSKEVRKQHVGLKGGFLLRK
jgi:hypothetical protein